MGIQNLSKFLKTNFPNVYKEIHLSEYKFKKVAIDTSNYMYKYKAACGDRWLSAFINLVICLRKNDIHCVFIYDSKAPEEKNLEKEKRTKRRNDLEMSVTTLENALKIYEETGKIHDILLEISKKKSPKRLLTDTENKNIDLNVLYTELEKKKKQIVNISPQDFDKTKELFNIMNVPYFQAPSEAETLCSYLCIIGEVDAVLSEDTDVLAYGSKYFLNKMDTLNEKCLEISYDNVLKNMELNSKQFLDFCIMCGTDYNENIKGVGPVNAYKLIKEHGDIDNLIKYTDENKEQKNKILKKCIGNFDTLKHVRVRQMFKDYEKPNIKVKYCAKPNMQEMQSFLMQNNCRDVRISRLENAYKQKIIIVEEEEEEEDE